MEESKVGRIIIGSVMIKVWSEKKIDFFPSFFFQLLN